VFPAVPGAAGAGTVLEALRLNHPRNQRASKLAPATPEQGYQLALEARPVRDYRAMLSLLRQAGEAGDLGAQESAVAKQQRSMLNGLRDLPTRWDSCEPRSSR
jgi:hypothetical protein